MENFINIINYNDLMNISQDDIIIYKNIENSINCKDFKVKKFK